MSISAIRGRNARIPPYSYDRSVGRRLQVCSAQKYRLITVFAKSPAVDKVMVLACLGRSRASSKNLRREMEAIGGAHTSGQRHGPPEEPASCIPAGFNARVLNDSCNIDRQNAVEPRGGIVESRGRDVHWIGVFGSRDRGNEFGRPSRRPILRTEGKTIRGRFRCIAKAAC